MISKIIGADGKVGDAVKKALKAAEKVVNTASVSADAAEDAKRRRVEEGNEEASGGADKASMSLG